MLSKEILKKIDQAHRDGWDELSFTEENFTYIPKQIFKIQTLKKLNLSRNKIEILPPEIGYLSNLITLDLSDNKLTYLPKEIGELINLEELNLGSFYGGNELSRLPPETCNLTSLRILLLRGNKFKKFPTEILQLGNLEQINISENQVRKVPPEIVALKKLTTLDLRGNQLIDLPTTINQLPNLQKISIISNYFKEVPSLFETLTNLRSLEIGNSYSHEDYRSTRGGNNLYELPRFIEKLINLEVIWAPAASIQSISFNFSNLINLRHLNLDGNLLTNLPKGLLSLEKLEELDLQGNPLPLPPEISRKSLEPKYILNYYFSTIEQKRKSINEIKLLCIGQGSVGKTSLVQQILYGTFDQNQTKTEGISINQWQVEGREKRETESQSEIENRKSEIRLNIWDFGGQEIMHATHQFFLTKRSLYLLVLDARLTQEENRVEYWLKIIQSFGGESPVLIVGNKTDQHPLDIDRTGLQKKYPNIVGILETSAATGAGIEALKAEIAKQVDTLPHVRDLLPETWFTVKSKLEELGKDKNFITQDEYLSLCGANDVTDETSQHTLIGFLHDLGVVLHFQDDPRLEALGILNPQWVTNGVYKILNSHELFQNQGTLTLPILNKTLNPPEYPSNKRLFIVDMMKKFELCYDIESDKSFLIPDLLPKNEPFTGEWDGALAFQYHYNVLPTSIISRFIVRMNAFIHKTIWRSGVVLKSGGNTALVKADTEDRKIYIWVSGDVPTRRDFLSAIRMEFDAIHKTIAKIEATEKVPLPNYPKADPVDHAFLLQLERDSRDSFPVRIDGKIVDINVRELLNGIRPSKNQAAKVFISYSHEDKSFVKKLAGELEAQSMKVWWDFEGLKGGQDWQKEIERGIKGCDFFLVALTPDAVTSEWVGNEIAYASNAQKTIIPLHLKKCDIPIGLIKKQYIDFEKQTQKVAIKELSGILKAKE